MTENKKPTTKKPPLNRKQHVIVFDHARVDSSHCLTDGLFRPLSRVPSKECLDVSHIYKGYTLRWLNYCKLNIVDQSVFLAIHRLASENGRTERVGDDHDSPVMKEVRAALKLEKEATKNDCLVLDTTLYEIAKTIGVTDGGDNLKMIRNSLIRLSCVSFLIYKGDDIGDTFFKTGLFSKLAGADGRIHVGINPMLGKALAGNQSTFVSMAEQRSLESDITKRLHVWLSSWMRSGEKRKIDIDKLVPHVWGENPEAETMRKRRHSIRKSLIELDTLSGWSATEESGSVVIHRKKL